MTKILCSGLLIDMDGVLVDSTAAIARVWTCWAARHNMSPAGIVETAHGRPTFATLEELLPNRSSEIYQEEIRWMEQAEIEDIADVVALPGARALLAAAPPGRRTVVTSASRPLAEVRLRAAGLWDLVSHLVTASDIQNGKPHPEPYIKGAEVLRIPSSACVVIEDASSGTQSGKAAGARVLALRTTSEDADLLAAGADWIVNNCASLRCSLANPGHELLLEWPEDEIPALPKMR